MNTNKNLSNKTSIVAGTGYSGRNSTAKHTRNALQRGGAVVDEDSDHESVGNTNTAEEEALLRSPARSNGAASDSKNRPRIKPDKEKLKVKARYKAAVKVCDRFGSKSNLTKQEEERLAWAREEIKNGRTFYAAKPMFAASNPKYANKIEEELAIKRQRSVDSEASGPSKKQKHRHETAKPKNGDERPTTSKAAAAASEIAKRHLIVALTDRSDQLGRMSQERWKVVEMKLLETLFTKMDAEPNAPMPAFDGAGWFKDDPTLTWLKEAVKTLHGLWAEASLEIVDRSCIPSIPKAKVCIPRVVKPKYALQLLQRQNTDVPTDDWKVLSVAKPATTDGGQDYIIQINKPAEDLLYA
ncbi:uncharacterized protein LOC129250277 [Anastrepha obliqua]|uniref:uncharacterized protein LOC129250277 n=1 Tax=Anastrepha obliqua TaxID=95512 RepID=UPI0024090C1F|nr:uncharacterized protein LOC129250277 [Anastrepha obliqua]